LLDYRRGWLARAGPAEILKKNDEPVLVVLPLRWLKIAILLSRGGVRNSLGLLVEV
jgi:hypothetical protein